MIDCARLVDCDQWLSSGKHGCHCVASTSVFWGNSWGNSSSCKRAWLRHNEERTGWGCRRFSQRKWCVWCAFSASPPPANDLLSAVLCAMYIFSTSNTWKSSHCACANAVHVNWFAIDVYKPHSISLGEPLLTLVENVEQIRVYVWYPTIADVIVGPYPTSLYWCSACNQVGHFGLLTLPSDCTSFPSSVLAPTCVLTKCICVFACINSDCSNVGTLLVLQVVACLYVSQNRVQSWKNNTMKDVKVLYKPCSSTTLSCWTVIHGFHVAASWLPCFDIDILDYVNWIENGRHMLNHTVHSCASRLCWSD